MTPEAFDALARKARSIGEAVWHVLPEGHEEHGSRCIALLDGEGVCLIQVGRYGANETREQHRERAQALADVLNGLNEAL